MLPFILTSTSSGFRSKVFKEAAVVFNFNFVIIFDTYSESDFPCVIFFR